MITEPNSQTQELFTAIENSSIEQVKRLLESGVDLTDQNVDGQTVLTVASTVGNSEIIQLLISAGAEVQPEPEPLVFQPQISHSRLPSEQNLGELIEQATENAPDEAKSFYAGLLSVMGASSDSSSNRDSNNDGYNEEQSAAHDDNEAWDDEDWEEENEDRPNTPLGAAVAEGNLDTVRALIAAGASPNPAAWHEAPVLTVAARRGHLEVVQTLVEAGSNVNGGFDALPLHTAAKKGHLEVVRFLLDAGAAVEGYEEDCWTALMAASQAGHLSVVQLLVEHGADVNAWSEGETPLMLAASNVHQEIYDFLYPLVSDEIRTIGDRDAEKEKARTIRRKAREQNKSVEKLIDAVIDRKLKKVQQLIADGVDLNAIAACNRTALSLAIQSGDISIIQTLLENGADPNLSDETDDGFAAESPLMMAAGTFFATNRADMVRLLIQQGADVNQQDAIGQTALMSALCYSDIAVIEALLEANADPNIEDKEGNTALMLAELRKLDKAADALLSYGAARNS